MRISLTLRTVRGWLCVLAVLTSILPTRADLLTAREAMENQANPLLLLTTSLGAIYIELFPAEAPANVANFVALAEGQIEFIDASSGETTTPRYFDGLRFHRVVPELLIQAGSPSLNPLGPPGVLLADEINATSLSLDRQTVLRENGEVNALLNVGNQADFARRVLEPLYAEMGIDSVEELDTREDDVVSDLRGLTLMRLYEHEGFSYQNDFPTRGISRGIVALANDGPNRNGPEFFIALKDSEWLNGRHTVIGKVVEGLDVADSIGEVAIDPLGFSPRSSVIYSIRLLNTGSL